MPIVYSKTEGWTISEATPEELLALMEIGKTIVVHGLAGDYVKEEYKNFLKHAPNSLYYKDI